MQRRAVHLLLVAVSVAACGDAGPAPSPDAVGVKGTPFLVAKPKELAPEAVSIGDPDVPRPGDAPPAPIVVAPRAPPPPAGPADGADDALVVTFDDLAGFECASYASTEIREIPEKIRALSGRRVAVDGFMMPLQYEAGGAKKFLLMRYKFGCCYAVSPKINEWMEVTMVQGVADYIPDTMATVWGVLDVKTETRDGVATGLYKMQATRSEFSEAK